MDLAQRLGVQAELDPFVATALGSEDVSPLDMAVGFSTFANRGVHNDPRLIVRIEQVDDDGDLTVLEEAHPSNDRVLPPEEADQVTYALRHGDPERHRDAPPASARPPPARPAPPATTATPGSSATRPSSPPRCGWATTTRRAPRRADMDDVHGIEVTGGSFPAQIWNKFMRNATSGMDDGLVHRAQGVPRPRPQPGARAHARLDGEHEQHHARSERHHHLGRTGLVDDQSSFAAPHDADHGARADHDPAAVQPAPERATRRSRDAAL